MFARGGGGCFLAGTQIETQDGTKSIETLKPGDKIISFEGSKIVTGNIVQTYEVERDYYYTISTDDSEVNVTAEHPFYIGQNTFKEAELLQVGETIYELKNNVLVAKTILRKVRVNQKVTAYNLQVDNPNTFFANVFAVHNKGGGGCFLPGTPVYTPTGSENIDDLNLGDSIISFDKNGNIVNSKIIEKYEVMRDYYYEIKTNGKVVKATAEHPFLTLEGYVEVKDLKEGNYVYVLKDNQMILEKIQSIKKIDEPTVAYNLRVDNTNTFFAAGFAVHNKGGGGFSGGSYGSSSYSPPANLFYYDGNYEVIDQKNVTTVCFKEVSKKYAAFGTPIGSATYPYCSCIGYDKVVYNGLTTYPSTTMCTCTNKPNAGLVTTNNICPLSLGEHLWAFSTGLLGSILENFCIVFYFLIVLYGFIKGNKNKQANSEWSSTIEVPRSQLNAKAKKTSALLESWAKADLIWDEKEMKKTAESTFYKLQECWSKREYEEMQPLLTPALYEEHTAQLEAMKQRHEINKMENVKLLDSKFILVTNHYDKTKDEFVCWFSAQAKDTIVDDRTNSKIRGDTGTGEFEEFWTFLRQGSMWKLKKISQPEESMDFVSMENYDELKTNIGLAIAYEKAGGAAKQSTKVEEVREQEDAGSGQIKDVKWKAERVHRLLNFLVQSDKIWKEEDMKETAQEMFIDVNTSIEKRNLSKLKNKMTQDMYDKLDSSITELILKKQFIQKRNLAARNVEIVLVKNYYDNKKDAFTIWISGQAQQVTIDEKTEQELEGDDYVKDFEEFWTFTRKGDVWLLSAIDPSFKMNSIINEENVDEGSTKFLMDWYYTRERGM